MDFSSLSRLPTDTWNGFSGSTNCHLVVQELGSLFCVVLICLQFFLARHLLIPVFIHVFRGDCKNLGYSQYHQSPVRLWTSSMPSSLPFSFKSMGLFLTVLEHGRVESPPSVNFDPDIPSQETLGACLWEMTHGILLDDACVLNSVGMIFRLEEASLCCRLERRPQHWR